MPSSGQRIRLVTPALPSSPTGNGVTSQRWASILRGLGHRVTVEAVYSGGAADVLVALHAVKSAASIAHFRDVHPSGPIVLALTGTDVYGDPTACDIVEASIAAASRFVVLQPLALERLPEAVRGFGHVIYQSAVAPPNPAAASRRTFDVAVLAHLRPVKDPLRAAAASRLLPTGSKVRVVHAGTALAAETEAEAVAEQSTNPRYRWLGGIPRWRAMRVLARSRLLALTSRSEGGANVVSEAVACSVPVLSSEIPGSIGILGPGYPGAFPVGDTEALAGLMRRAEEDEAFYEDLQARVRDLAPLVDPARERECWAQLLALL